MSVSQIGIAQIPENQRMLGKGILVLTTAVLISTFVFQLLHKTETISAGFENWQPVMYAYLVWAIGLCWSQVLIRGERGKRALFVLPAFLFTIAMVIFPLLFGIYIALHDWNLSSFEGMKYNGLDNEGGNQNCSSQNQNPFSKHPLVLRDLGNSYLRHRHQRSETLGKQRLVTYKK